VFGVPQSSQRSQESAVDAANRLRAGRSVVRMSAEARNSCLLHNVHSVCEAHSSGSQVSCSEIEEAGREDRQGELRMS